MDSSGVSRSATTLRLRELDFLREAAILLTIIRHIKLPLGHLKQMAWIGVDLFFVLSGFLVSGLLFREYQKFGNVEAVKFLIRRGFKIYPVYYILCAVYLIWFAIIHQLIILSATMADLVFIQNYIKGWGYIFSASWSLDVEEHFYVLVAVTAWYITTMYRRPHNSSSRIDRLEWLIISIMVLCLIMRLIQNHFYPGYAINHTMTHLRIDSLLAGVLIAYEYYFYRDRMLRTFAKIRSFIFPIAALLLSFTIFLPSETSFFVRTIGFTLIFIAFSLVLIYFILDEDINGQLDKVFSRPVVNIVSRIGFYSYAIYIIHILVIKFLDAVSYKILLLQNPYLFIFLVYVLSILSGWIITDVIEKFFLNIRDKFYPKRTS